MLTNTRFYDLIHSPYFLDLLKKRLIAGVDSSLIIQSALDVVDAMGMRDKAFFSVLNKAKDQISLMEDAFWMMFHKSIAEFKKIIAQIEEQNFSILFADTHVDEENNVITKYLKTPALESAITLGGKDFVAVVLEHGADPNIKFPSGFTSLTQAATLPPPLGAEIVELLLSKGARINEKNQFGSTPLNTAALHGNYELVQLLIKKGANIETRAAGGFTPFLSNTGSHIENLRNQLETALVLIKNGADINAQTTFNGKTALIFAVKHDNPQLVGMLLKHGADAQLEDNKGNTALSIAKKKNNPQILKLFAQYKN